MNFNLDYLLGQNNVIKIIVYRKRITKLTSGFHNKYYF